MAITRLEAGKHTCLGTFSEPAPEASDGETMLERPALLVYEGEFESMDGPVEITREHLMTLANNHNSLLSKIKRLATGETPLRDCPPLQVDHSTSAMMTVGRVVGDLTLGAIDVDGVQRMALYTSKVRVLGKENVEKVRDGRWIHLSIGADLASGKLNELSITPFPAAQMASMLSRKKQGDESMSFLAKLFGKKLAEMSDADKEQAEKFKKHLMEQGCTEDDCVKKMAEMDDECKKKLASEIEEKEKLAAEETEKQKLAAQEEEQKKLAAEEEEKKKLAAEEEAKQKLAAEETDKAKAQMAASRESFTKLAAGFKAANQTARMAARKGSIMVRLAKLRADARITPAEIKKMDVAKLASYNDATIDAVLRSYQDREPVIVAGCLGSAKAEDMSKIGTKIELARLEAETRLNMPSKKGTVSMTEGVAQAPEQTQQPQMAAGNEELSTHCSEVEKLLSDGKHAEAVESMKRLLERIRGTGQQLAAPEEVPASVEAQMSALAESVETMQTQFGELIKLAGPSLGVEKLDL